MHTIGRPPDGQHTASGGFSRCRHRLTRRMGHCNHANTIIRQHLSEQALLGGGIGLGRSVIIHMIAAQIGKAGHRQLDAIKPVLRQAVTGGFHRQMGDMMRNQIAQGRMQAHRLGRSVGQRIKITVGLNTQRPHRRRFMTRSSQNLTHKTGG